MGALCAPMINVGTKMSQQLSSNILKPIQAHYGDYFQCAIENFSRIGTTIAPHENLKGTGRIAIYSIGPHTFLRTDPALVETLETLNADTQSSSEMILALFDGRAELGASGINYFLDETQFTPANPPAGFKIRQLPPVHDETLTAFFDACDIQDLEAVEIELDNPDPIIFGCFYGDEMVSYASHRYEGDTLADIGVLTRPDFRGRGLGKAVVSADALWCLHNNVVAMYRFDVENIPSSKIPRSLGFTDYIYITIVKLKTKGHI